MARRKKDGGHESHERWLVSYADFITLLFAFFVVMFATSQTDKNKAQAVQDAVQKALEQGKLSAVINVILGGSPVDKKKNGNAQMKGASQQKDPPTKQPKEAPKVAALDPSLQLLSKELAQEIRTGRIAVAMEPRGLVISFRQAALFPSGGASITSDARPSLAKIAGAIGQLPNPVRLEGHTDSVPIHNAHFQSNWELSAARSISLLRVMTEEDGIVGERLSIAGYADNEPADSNETEEGRSRNRRVDIVILNETGVAAEPARGPPAAH